jgi:hypothetical protein
MARHVRAMLTTGLLACTTLFITPPALADDAPRSYVASPDVYKVLAENSKTKVILITLQPSQRTKWYSQPRSGVYFLTDCNIRIHTPDGAFYDVLVIEGRAEAQPAIPSRSVENRGSVECRMIRVEQEQE